MEALEFCSTTRTERHQIGQFLPDVRIHFVGEEVLTRVTQPTLFVITGANCSLQAR
jgi:hypothetical protein